MSNTYVIAYGGQPWTVNTDRNLHPHQRARRIKEFRQAFWALAREQRIPPLGGVRIEAQVCQQRGKLADLAAYAVAVKAAVDGLTDARVFPDDDQEHLVGLTFLPTIRGPWRLTLTVTGEAQSPSPTRPLRPIS